MSDISAVQTAIAKSAGPAAAADKSGLFADMTGLNFFDLLFTQVTPAEQTGDETIVAFDLTGQGTVATLDSETLKNFKAALENLLQGLPADQRPVTVKLSGEQLQKIVQKLTADAATLNNKQQNLIATGLTPEQLTRLSDLLQDGDVEKAGDDVQAILIGILKLVPDGEKTEPVFFPKTLIAARESKTASQDETAPEQTEEDKDQDDSTLNPLCIIPVPQTVTATQVAATGGEPAVARKGGGFNDVLKLFEGLQSKTAPVDIPADPEAAQPVSPRPGPVNSTTPTATVTTFDSLFAGLSADGDFNSVFPDGLDWAKSNQYGLSNLQASTAMNAASLVTQAPGAAQAHPATAIVAATLARTAAGGENKTLTLHLNPPELGKIEVQMQFTKDKSVKTHMVFEKPETMLMMQRDAHILDRAMQDSGMTGGSGLSFELAGHDTAFGGGRNGGDQAGRGGAGGTDEPQMIETTLSWTVDAETGLKHYNVLV